MDITIKNVNLDKGNYKLITWAANTTGNQIKDEICELAGFSVWANSSFSEYIMPYCNVKRKYWEEHGLKEINGRKFRTLLDCHENKVLSTKTEIYGLGGFLNWLEMIKGQSGGIILVCYEPNDYVSQIFMESLHRCRLNERFLKIVKYSINCYDICKDKYGNQVKYCSLSNINNMLFNHNVDFKRALSRAKVCYKIITHIRDDLNSSVEFIEQYIRTIVLKQQSQDQLLEIRTVNDRKKTNSKKVSFELNGRSRSNTAETNKVDSSNKLSGHEGEPNYLKCKIIGWAANTTGWKYEDELLHITAFSPDSTFSQYIMPKKRIYTNQYRHKIRIIKENDTKQLKDLETQEILQTKPEELVLQDFILWLEQIKGDYNESIIILYHEDKMYTLAILLESLKRCKLIEAFSNIVEGFVNIYILSEDECKHLTKTFTLKNLSILLLKKQIEIANAMIRAKVCYEIIEHLTQVKTGKLAKENADILNLIQPFVSTIPNEEELACLKETKKSKSIKKANQPKPVRKSNSEENIK